ncbi:MAG TPA: gluconate 2-dehydrogenase subunit 3 family protein [Blastocatellia bacterium]|nr:gluconate 2-dehydrogenase subunit 3 family protein [Blastocatellia bacterium]
MADNKMNRRESLKVIAVGTGTAISLPVLSNHALGQHEHHGGKAAGKAAQKKAHKPKFFTAQELATVATISELIIPTDDHSPGAKAAGVPEFIDFMVSEMPQEEQKLWRDGLAAVEKMSREKFTKDFNGATQEQQVAILTEISRNERNPQTVAERFFKAIKNWTLDGYYTSEVGIHKDLQYKGNSYVKEYRGCVHPEHDRGV